MSVIRRFFLVTGALVALSVPAAGTAAQTSAPPNELHFVKDCATMDGTLGAACVVTSSSLPAITVGAKQIYYGPQLTNPMFLSSSVVLDAGDGNTAFGYCMVDMHAAPLGMCTYWAGTGTLKGFNAVVNVTVDDAGLWHLDGTYFIAPAQ